MIFINKLFNNKEILTKTILIFFFIASWISIGTSYQNLKLFFFNEEITIVGIINTIRVLINLIGFPILCFLFIKQLFKTKDDIIKELGDVIFYVTALANYYGSDLQEVIEKNVVKLDGREARGTLKGNGDNR